MRLSFFVDLNFDLDLGMGWDRKEFISQPWFLGYVGFDESPLQSVLGKEHWVYELSSVCRRWFCDEFDVITRLVSRSDI